MKKFFRYIFVGVMALTATSCNDFLSEDPKGVIDQDKAFSRCDAMVTSAYAMLGDCWYSYPFNLWPYGDLASDDCLKGGSGTTDTGYHAMEIWSTLTSTQGEFDELWYRLYCAISRCNRALLSLEEYGQSNIGDEKAKQRIAEVKFLRAHFYFKLITMFRQVPWIDENVTKNNLQEKTSNTEFTYEQLFQ